MAQIIEWLREAFTAPNMQECGECGADLSRSEGTPALGAPGLYCSDDCADEAMAVWAR